MNDIKPFGSKKFRENNADSVLFHLKDHTPELPRTLTVTRTLPTPRKGNAGTMKVMFNIRRTYEIPSGTGFKTVPAIVKLETSMPVGLKPRECIETLMSFGGITTDVVDYDETREAIFIRGELPDGIYDTQGFETPYASQQQLI